jgi:hypothetical protein
MDQHGWKSNCPTLLKVAYAKFRQKKLNGLYNAATNPYQWANRVEKPSDFVWTEAFALAENLTHNFLLNKEVMYSR